jgi:hypothetical protein
LWEFQKETKEKSTNITKEIIIKNISNECPQCRFESTNLGSSMTYNEDKAKKPTLRHITIKLSKHGNSERVFRARKETCYIQDY